jgi:hypothetical protein
MKTYTPESRHLYSIVDHQGKCVVVSSILDGASVRMHLFTCSAVHGSLRIGDRPHAQDHRSTCVAVSGKWAAAQHRPGSCSAASVYQCISIWLLRISFWSNAYERRGICAVASGTRLAATRHHLSNSGAPSVQQICTSAAAFEECAQHW